MRSEKKSAILTHKKKSSYLCLVVPKVPLLMFRVLYCCIQKVATNSPSKPSKKSAHTSRKNAAHSQEQQEQQPRKDDDTTTYRGNVIFFDSRRHFGFIRESDDRLVNIRGDVFAATIDLKCREKDLHDGRPVEFNVRSRPFLSPNTDNKENVVVATTAAAASSVTSSPPSPAADKHSTKLYEYAAYNVTLVQSKVCLVSCCVCAVCLRCVSAMCVCSWGDHWLVVCVEEIV